MRNCTPSRLRMSATTAAAFTSVLPLAGKCPGLRHSTASGALRALAIFAPETCGGGRCRARAWPARSFLGGGREGAVEAPSDAPAPAKPAPAIGGRFGRGAEPPSEALTHSRNEGVA